MNARITALDFKMPRSRARITRIGFDPERITFAVTCRCGMSSTVHSEGEARERKREHDAAHRRAEAAHPAGKARRGGTPGGAA